MPAPLLWLICRLLIREEEGQRGLASVAALRLSCRRLASVVGSDGLWMPLVVERFGVDGLMLDESAMRTFGRLLVS